MRRGRLPRLALAAALAWLAAGCAPHLLAPPPLERPALPSRFTMALRSRIEQAALAEGELSLWARVEGADPLPGVSARVLLEAPDAFRIRVAAPLGTAVDAAVRGDSLVLEVPASKLSAVAAGEDAGGVRIGSLVYRLLSATWAPPGEAWPGETAEDSLLRLSWREGRDSLELLLGSSGLPAAVRLRVGAMAEVAARYDRWRVWDGVAWPSRILVTDATGRRSLTAQVEFIKLKPAPRRPSVRLRVPAHALRLSRDQWIRMLEQLEALGHTPEGKAETRE